MPESVSAIRTLVGWLGLDQPDAPPPSEQDAILEAAAVRFPRFAAAVKATQPVMRAATALERFQGRVQDVYEAAAAHPLGRLADLTGVSDLAGMAQSFREPVEVMAGTIDPLPKPKLGIKAYHGSPHDFEKFSTAKIGTGEGAQAYGHGLYFAESEGVAKSYRKPGMHQHTIDTTIDGTPAKRWQDAAGRTPVEVHAADALHRTANVDQAISYLQQDEAYNTTAAQAKQWLEQNRQRIGDTGHTYEVNLKADPDTMLDWDAPLSQQPENVKAALKEYGIYGPRTTSTGAVYDPPGSVAYDALSARYGKAAVASDALRVDRIPGIKYLDQGSRAAGAGSRNYVIFDDATIDILRKYGLLLPAAGLGGAAMAGQD